MNPVVSIIVPVYRAESYLLECIKSLRLQSFKEFEIILVNDSSPDNCGRIIEKYKKRDRRIISVENPVNLGLHEARKVGVRFSQAEYIVMCDADDCLPPHAVSSMVCAAKNTIADIVHGCTYALKPMISTERLWVYDPFNVTTGRGFTFRILNNLRGWNLWGKMIRRDRWNQVLELIPENRGLFLAEDLLTSYFLGLVSPKYTRLNEVVYYYRQPRHGYLDNMGARTKAISDYIEVLRLIRSSPLERERKLDQSIDHLTRHILSLLIRYSGDDKSGLEGMASEIGEKLGSQWSDYIMGREKQRTRSLARTLMNRVEYCDFHELSIALWRFSRAVRARGFTDVLKQLFGT